MTFNCMASVCCDTILCITGVECCAVECVCMYVWDWLHLCCEVRVLWIMSVTVSSGEYLNTLEKDLVLLWHECVCCQTSLHIEGPI